MEKQLKNVTLWTAVPMAVLLVISLALIPPSINAWKIDTGIAPSLMVMIISISYIVLVFIAAIVLNLRGKGEIAARIIRVNGINLIAFLAVFFILFIIGTIVTEGAGG